VTPNETLDDHLASQIVDSGNAGIIVLNTDQKVIFWNNWMVSASDIPKDAAFGLCLKKLFPEIRSGRIPSAISDVLERRMSSMLSSNLNKTLFPLKARECRCGTGEFMNQMVVIKPLPDNHCLIHIFDTTKSTRREEVLHRQARSMEVMAESYRLSELRTRAIVDNALDAIITFDARGAIETFNPAAERLFGFQADQIIGKNVETVLQWSDESSKPEDSAATGLWRRLADDHEIHECSGLRRNGDVISLELSVGVMSVDGQNLFVAMARDISLRKQATERIRRLAHYDELTGVPNRTLFHERLSQEIKQAARTKGHGALMMLDLDHFKEVNDTHGHYVGDLLLAAVAKRIQKTLRDSDTLARLGGDEFAILATNLANADGAGTVAETIVKTIRSPYGLGGQNIKSSISIGITIFPDDGGSADALMINADMALYRAKSKGRNTYQFYLPEMNAQVQANKTIELDLRRSMDRNELALSFQPLVSASDGIVSGVEVLARWSHPERGEISAKDFIPIIERTDLILPLGQWVIRNACAQAQAWREQGMPPLILSINLSSIELRNQALLETIKVSLHDFSLDPAQLQLEFRSDTFLATVRQSPEIIEQFKALGVRLCIDDFGTGALSLDRLKRFPVDQLKISPSFLENNPQADEKQDFFSSLVGLGHGLGATINVKNIETSDQLDFARRNDVEAVQGYFLGRPMSADEIADLIGNEAPLFEPLNA
jgi:diguanylate cyclase (GGDEF)-like protein/PAS domain S-box-containing protein